MKRKFIDEKGRIFGAVSVIDIIVVVIVLVLGAAIYVRFFEKTETSVSSAADKFTYEIVVQGVRKSTADAFRTGDALYENENGTSLGTITGVSAKDAMQETRLTDGTCVYAQVRDRYDVTLTVAATGLISDGRYYASKTYEINANSKIDIYTKYCSTSAFVWSIDGVD